jgi:hypothetical protein
METEKVIGIHERLTRIETKLDSLLQKDSNLEQIVDGHSSDINKGKGLVLITTVVGLLLSLKSLFGLHQ